MDIVGMLNKSEPHQRTIIHLDMDYFYAQVEEIRDPTLRNRPLGIQQKNIVVTCNYVARARGVSKLMLITEALQVCPDLVLVNGEDLAPYRLISQKIHDLLLNYTPNVEKLGFDENFMDVSTLVEMRLAQSSTTVMQIDLPEVVGHIYPAGSSNAVVALSSCGCGCARRLALGTQIAREIRNELHLRLGITCCAGISYNKLLSKLVGSRNKPNQQTVLVSTHAEQFMRELHDLQRITGIGQKTHTLLLHSGVADVTQLQLCDMEFLRKKFGFETATKLKDLAFGRDASSVRPTGKPKSIGMEDACKPISVLTDVEDKFRLLLMRLVEQVAEDGRIPIVIKVVLRKFDPQKKSSHRETKQANIMPSLFKSTTCGGEKTTLKVQLAEGAQEKLLKIIMRLFERIVDLNKPFNITLLGLAFSKFQERKVGSSSIANFLIKKTDLEVQSITSLTNTSLGRNAESLTTSLASAAANSSGDEAAFRSSPTTFKPSDQFYRRRATTASPVPMLLDNGSESAATNSDFSDFSETEVEPSPKKSRIGRLLVPKRSRLADSATDLAADVASPSKLRVCDLRLNSRDSEKDFPMSPIATTPSTSSGVPAPRFRTIQPPNTLLSRIDGGVGGGNGKRFMPSRHTRTTSRLSSNASSTPSSPLPSPMEDACSSTASTPTALIEEMPTEMETTKMQISEADSVAISPTTSETLNNETAEQAHMATAAATLAHIPCPAGVDAQVFNELPTDVQNELIASWRSSLAAAANAVANGAGGSGVGTTATTTPSSSTSSGSGPSAAAGTQKNTLYRYFLRNK